MDEVDEIFMNFVVEGLATSATARKAQSTTTGPTCGLLRTAAPGYWCLRSTDPWLLPGTERQLLAASSTI